MKATFAFFGDSDILDNLPGPDLPELFVTNIVKFNTILKSKLPNRHVKLQTIVF